MAGSYLDPLLNVEVDAAGAIVAKAGGAAGGGVNFVSPLTAVRNAQTGKVDVGGSGASGAWSFADITLPPEVAPTAPSNGWTIYVDSTTGQLTAKDSAGNTIIMSADRTTITTSTLNANNAPAHVGLFQVTGTIMVKRLLSEVTSAFGTNHTGVQFTVYDQSTRSGITAAAGAHSANSAPVGTTIIPGMNPTVVAMVLTSGGALVSANDNYESIFPEMFVQAKHGATTVIEYTYTTTNTPTTGTIESYMVWVPLTNGATVTAV